MLSVCHGANGLNNIMLREEKAYDEKSSYVTITYKEDTFPVIIPFQDQASVENAIHCMMVMLYFGYNQKTIQARMAQLYPVEMRLKLKNGINNCTLIDDSYSADFQ